MYKKFLFFLALIAALGWLYFGIYEQNKIVKTQEEALSHISATLLNYQERFEQIADHSNQMVASIKALDETLRSDSQAWRLMQAQNYIESAMIEANLLKDPASAISLLAAAQASLIETGNPALNPVIEATQKDILMLGNLASVNLTSLLLSLNNLIDQVPALPHKIRIQTDFMAQDPPAETNSAPWEKRVNTAWQEVKSLIRIQRHDRPITPYFATQDIELINENLSLMLRQASFAAAKGENVLYQKELLQAQNWIKEYYDLNQPAVQKALETLKSLSEISVTISTPLNLETVHAWGYFVKSKQKTEQ